MKTRYSAATKNVLIFFISLFIILLFNSCQSEQKQVDSAYIAEINEWHKGRIERLTQPDGWLSLAGLFWLKEGSQTIGAAPSNDIVFPEKAPAEIGVITLTDGELHIKILPGIDVKYENMPVQEMRLQSDADGKPTKLESGSLNWLTVRTSPSAVTISACTIPPEPVPNRLENGPKPLPKVNPPQAPTLVQPPPATNRPAAVAAR